MALIGIQLFVEYLNFKIIISCLCVGKELVEEQICKQNYLEKFKKAQDEGEVFERDLQSMMKEKEEIVKERDRHQRFANETQRKLKEKEKRITRIEKESSDLRDVNEKLQNDKSSFESKLEQSVSSSRQLKQQIDEVKWEKQQMEQRMSVSRQNEGNLRTVIDQLVAEVDNFSKEVKETVPDIVYEGQSKGARPLNMSSDTSSHLKKTRSVVSSVLSELKAIVNQNKMLEKKHVTFESQLRMKESSIKQVQRSFEGFKKESEITRSKLEKKVKQVTDSCESKLQMSQEEITVLNNCELIIK